MKFITRILYNFGIQLYILSVRIAALFNTKAKLMVNGRLGLFNKIDHDIENDHRQKIWFHCASLGEFEQVRPLIEDWKSNHVNDAIVVTFFSPSGYELRKNYPIADYIYYLPYDTYHNAQRFVSNINPRIVFFAKYDIWFHYLSALKTAKIPAYLVSANFRNDQVYFKWYGSFFKEMLFSFKHIFSQFETSTQLLIKNGISHASTSGDTRYDRVLQLSGEVKDNELIRTFKDSKQLLVLGSSYKEEEQLLAEIFTTLNDVKVIIAPHQITEQRIQSIEATFKSIGTIRYSVASNNTISQSKILILDNIGMLATLYHYADIAVVGGGFGLNGIHNILEPLSHGAFVLIGPLNHTKFPETILASENRVLATFSNSIQLYELIHNHYISTNSKRLTKEQIINFVKANAGATKRILSLLN